MRKFNYLLGMLAVAASFTACSSDDNTVDNKGFEGAGKAYIAVKLVTPQTTRATTANDFEDGTGNENTANSARFYFFKEDGSAFIASGSQSYVDKSISLSDSNDPYADATTVENVEKKSEPVIVIENATDKPAYVVAILNPTDLNLPTSPTLTELEAVVDAYTGTGENQFVMSNSVYAQDGVKMVATELKPENVQLTEDLAKTNPVDIYVERVLAKVTVSPNDGTTTFDTGETTSQDEGNTKIYAKIIGWKLFDTTDKSFLLKSIDASWTNEGLGINPWSEAVNHRSYWATTTTDASITNSTVTYSSISTQAQEYCLENTTSNHTQVYVAAQLVDENGDPIEIAVWKGARMTVDGLKNTIADVVKGKVWYKNTSGEYETLLPSMIDFEAATGTGAESYEVQAKLATGAPTEFYSDAKGTSMTEDAVKVLLNAQKARIYKDGKTYYFGAIKHLGSEGTTGEYGIVRNHVYKYNITGVQGLGTPVFDPDTAVDPTKPTDEKAYIAARLYVLAWRIVSNNVTLK